MKKQLIAAVTVASLLGFAGGTAVQAFNLGSILKVGGISVLVSKYGDSINDFLNKLLMKNGVGTDYASSPSSVSVRVNISAPSRSSAHRHRSKRSRPWLSWKGNSTASPGPMPSSQWRRRMSPTSTASRASASRQQSISSSDAFPKQSGRGKIRQPIFIRRPFA